MRRIIICAVALSILGALTAIAEAAYTLSSTYAVGPQPFGIVSDPADGRVYVANSAARLPDGRGTISVIDPSTGSVSTLFTSQTAGLLAIDSASRRLYSSNSDPLTNSVSVDVLDLDAGTLVATLSVGGLGVGVDASASRLVAASARVVFVVDTTTLAVTNMRSAPGTESWFGVAVDPVLHHAYVTNIDSSAPSVVVLDSRDLTMLGEIALSSVPRFAIAVDPGTHRVFVGGSDRSGPPFLGSAVYAIDGVTLSVVATTPLRGFPGGIALAPATGHLYVTDSFGNVSISPPGYPVNELDMSTLATTQTLSSPTQPALDVLGPDGRLYVAGNGGNGGVVEAFTFPPPDRAPVIDSVTVTPASPRTNDVVIATAAAHDPDGDALTYTYTWIVNGASRRTTTTASPTDTFDLAVAGNGDKGDIVSVSVIASDGTLSSAPTSASVTVVDSAPTVAVALNTTTPRTNDALVATATGADADLDALSYTYTWSVNGTTRRTKTTAATTDTFDLSLAGNGDKGDTIVVSVIASDGTLSGAAASASATVANTPPTVSVSLNTATPRSNDTLIATATGNDADHDALSYTYTWSVNKKVMQVVVTTSATSSFDLHSNDVGNGDLVTVTVTASDGSATSAPATTSAAVGKN